MDRIDELVIKLSGGDLAARIEAAKELGRIHNARAIEPLSRVLRESDFNVWNLRKAAVQALGEIGDAAAIEPLIGVWTDKVISVRMAAVKALGKIGGAEAIEALSRALTNDKDDLGKAAAWALGEIGMSIPENHPLVAEASRLLMLALTDKRYTVRLEAARELGRIRRREALPALKRRLRIIGGESLPQVRDEIRTAVASIESATAGVAGLPRAAKTDAPTTTGRPRTADDAPKSDGGPRHGDSSVGD